MSLHRLPGRRQTARHPCVRSTHRGLWLALAFGLAGAAQAQTPAPAGPAAAILSAPQDVVATVNGQPIRNAELLIMTGQILAGAQPTRRSDITDAEQAARERLIRLTTLAQEATRLGIDRDPSVQGILAYQNTVSLANAYLKHRLRQNPVTDAMVESEYGRTMADGKQREYHVRHILVSQESRAKDAIAALNKGEDFVTIARLHSGDPNVSTTGGDLGWLRLDNFEDFRFVDAVLQLKPGRYTPAPVLSASGWHVIQLVEAPRPVENTTPFAQLPPASQGKLRRRATQRAIDKLEAEAYTKAKVTRTELRTLESAEVKAE